MYLKHSIRKGIHLPKSSVSSCSSHWIMTDGYCFGKVVCSLLATGLVHQALPISVRGCFVKREPHGPAVGDVALVPAHAAPRPRRELHPLPVRGHCAVIGKDFADHHVETELHKVEHFSAPIHVETMSWVPGWHL